MPLRFDAAALNAQLAALPTTGDNAVVLDVDPDGAHVAVHLVYGDRWIVRGVYAHGWNGDDGVAGQLVYHWPVAR